MIRVHRGVEPAGLDGTRTSSLAQLRSTIATKGEHALVRSDFPTGYTSVGETLRQRQHLKCCYCELKVRHQGQDVEHYRPASKYWWLAYTWENLLFACQNCNRWGKNDHFPLEATSTKLTAESSPPGGEKPLLIDPAATSENPTDHLQFVLDASSGSWNLKPRANSARGAMTIQVLKLNANDLVELYDDHVAQHVKPDVDEAEAALRRGDKTGFAAHWRKLSVRNLGRTMPFSALAYDATDHYFPAARRAQLRVELIAPQ